MTLGVGFCSIELGAGKDKPPTRFLLLKEGDIGWVNLEGVTLDAKQAAGIIEAFVTHGVDLVIDYEHSTSAVETGKVSKAPAAGWIKRLAYVEGEGLYAEQVEWTDGASDEIKAHEYKYSSPVIIYDKETKVIERLHSVALTNKPRTIGQSELLAAARAIVDIQKEYDVKKGKDGKLVVEISKDQGVLAFLQAQEDLPEDAPAMSADQAAIGRLLGILNEKDAGLPDNATLAMIIQAAIDILGGGSEEAPVEDESASMKAIGARLGAKDGKTETILAAIDSIRATTVPGEAHKLLQGRVAELEAEKTERLVAAKIEGYVSTGQLNPNDDKKMEWAREACARNPEDFDTLMAGAPKLFEPGTKTVGNSSGPKTGREGVIAANVKEWKDSPDAIVGGDCCAWVNQGLRDNSEKTLTDAERKNVEVMAGKN